MKAAGLLRTPLLMLLVWSTLAGCSDPAASDEPVVVQLQVLAGDGQTGRTGEQLPNPLTVAVLDHQNRPVPGVTVAFTVELGSGSVSPQDATTDEKGIARSRWTLGAPGNQQVSASVRNWEGRTLTALFTAEATP